MCTITKMEGPSFWDISPNLYTPWNPIAGFRKKKTLLLTGPFFNLEFPSQNLVSSRPGVHWVLQGHEWKILRRQGRRHGVWLRYEGTSKKPWWKKHLHRLTIAETNWSKKKKGKVWKIYQWHPMATVSDATGHTIRRSTFSISQFSWHGILQSSTSELGQGSTTQASTQSTNLLPKCIGVVRQVRILASRAIPS